MSIEKDLGLEFLQEIKSVHIKLKDIWKEIGYNEIEIKENTGEVISSLRSLLKHIEKKEVSKREKLIESIDEAGLKLFNITKELEMPSITEPEINLPLRELEKFLQDKLVLYQKEASKRTKTLEEYEKRCTELKTILSEDSIELPSGLPLSISYLEQYEKIIKSLEIEREHRLKTFRSLRGCILNLMEEIELTPRTSFEREVSNTTDDLFILSQENIKKMKRLSEDLKNQAQLLRDREKQLWKKITTLWDRLSIDEERRTLVKKSISGYPVANISKFTEELKYLEELKLQNLGHLINRLRRELEDWWEKCYVSEDEKENFKPYFEETYSDELLQEHEAEVEKFKEFYNQNEEIFLKVKRWENVWHKVNELEEKAHDPGRLFGNRGGALLLEEKERRRVNNELPRLEKELNEKIMRWQEDNGHPFLLCGQTFDNFIKHQWQEYNKKKIREKQSRDVRLGTNRTPQRKRIMTRSETFRSSKYLRNNESVRTPTGSSSSGSFLSRCSSRNNLAISPMNPRSQTRATGKGKERQRVMKYSSFSSSDTSSYDKFKEGIQRLSERENIRSSVAPHNKGSSITPKAPKGLPRTPLTTTRLAKDITPSSSLRRRPLTPSNLQNVVPTPVGSGSATRRRSSRLNRKGLLFSSHNGHSPIVKSQVSGYGASRLTTPIRNRLNFLM